MATYAIGDVQGCFAELQALLERFDFDAARDRLLFVGDLVNRGPASLAVLRFVRALGESACTVLGNHDLHLLATAAGVRTSRDKDTLQAVLDAPDATELVEWIAALPMTHVEAGFAIVHAGLPPQWDVARAVELGHEVETVLRGGERATFLRHMYGNQPDLWREDLQGWERLRFITNALTRLRYVDVAGRLDIEETGPPGTQAEGLVPWFEAPGRKSLGERIAFGHWSTLQLEQELDPSHGVYHLDTGCVWGGRMTALRLEDEAYFSVPCGGGG